MQRRDPDRPGRRLHLERGKAVFLLAQRLRHRKPGRERHTRPAQPHALDLMRVRLRKALQDHVAARAMLLHRHHIRPQRDGIGRDRLGRRAEKKKVLLIDRELRRERSGFARPARHDGADERPRRNRAGEYRPHAPTGHQANERNGQQGRGERHAERGEAVADRMPRPAKPKKQRKRQTERRQAEEQADCTGKHGAHGPRRSGTLRKIAPPRASLGRFCADHCHVTARVPPLRRHGVTPITQHVPRASLDRTGPTGFLHR